MSLHSLLCTCRANRSRRAGNARPYDMDFSADEDSTYGTGLPIPYRGAGQSWYRTIGKRQFHGFAGIFDTGLTQYMYKYSLNALLKNL